MAMIEPISKTLPVGLCRAYATEKSGGDRISICLVNPLKEASPSRCSTAGCSCYSPEWYGFKEPHCDDE